MTDYTEEIDRLVKEVKETTNELKDFVEEEINIYNVNWKDTTSQIVEDTEEQLNHYLSVVKDIKKKRNKLKKLRAKQEKITLKEIKAKFCDCCMSYSPRKTTKFSLACKCICSKCDKPSKDCEYSCAFHN